MRRRSVFPESRDCGPPLEVNGYVKKNRRLGRRGSCNSSWRSGRITLTVPDGINDAAGNYRAIDSEKIEPLNIVFVGGEFP
jgi:hypothetical protein